MADAFVPYVPPERRLPEITIKAVVLGAVLAVILGAANTYLGLRVGMTVSASIPAAVVSMAVLRLFRNRNILENNLVQTAASAGEALAAGVLFTLPALLILGYWQEIHYLETTAIALAGGALGVFFTVPLRRALIVEMPLTFPEGIATAEVLKAGEGKEAAEAAGGTLPAKKAKGATAPAPTAAATGILALLVGTGMGAVYKFLQTGTKMWSEEAVFGRRFGDSGVVAFGGTLSPALLGVGYIIGLRIASLVFLGGVIGWLVGIPWYTATQADAPAIFEAVRLSVLEDEGRAATAADFAGGIWSTRIRYMGVGAMLVGGLWTLIQLRGPLTRAIGRGMGIRRDEVTDPLRTEQELGMRATFFGVALLSVPLFLIYWFATGDLGASLVLAVIMIVAGFLFSGVAAYMAGLVGSSSNPISGVTIITVLFSAFMLRLMGLDAGVGPAAAIFVAGTIAAAAAIGGDNMQDLKAGYLLGATPRKQQIMQFLGVGAAALTVALVLQVLTSAYDLGSADLTAPQASLMAAVANMVFGIGELPQTMLVIGAAIAFAVIVGDEILRVRGAAFRMPVMAVAVGIYLPVGLSLPIFLGGLLAWGTARAMRAGPEGERMASGHKGVLFGSGLIAGEALIGIGIAALVAGGVEDVLAVSDGTLRWVGVLLFAYLAAMMAYFVVRPRLVDR